MQRQPAGARNLLNRGAEQALRPNRTLSRFVAAEKRRQRGVEADRAIFGVIDDGEIERHSMSRMFLSAIKISGVTVMRVRSDVSIGCAARVDRSMAELIGRKCC